MEQLKQAIQTGNTNKAAGIAFLSVKQYNDGYILMNISDEDIILGNL